MGTLRLFKTKDYSGRVYEARDNMVVEKRTGPESVSLSAPIDFVDSCLKDYVNTEVKITITVTIEDVE